MILQGGALSGILQGGVGQQKRRRSGRSVQSMKPVGRIEHNESSEKSHVDDGFDGMIDE